MNKTIKSKFVANSSGGGFLYIRKDEKEGFTPGTTYTVTITDEPERDNTPTA